MVQFAAALLRGVIAMFAGLLIAGGTLVLAADQAPIDRPTLVSVAAAPATLTVPDVTAQAYVFAKGILQDHGFAWHVTGPVQGYAANTVGIQQPSAGTIVLDTGAPTITLTLAPNPAYVEKGTPENDAPYPGTAIRIPGGADKRPHTSVKPHLEPVPIPGGARPTTTVAVTPKPAPVTPAQPTPVDADAQPVTPAPVTTTPAVTTPAVTTPAVKPTPAPTTPVPTVTPSGPRTPDFKVPGSPKEPARAASLPDRVAALSVFVETHHSATAANLNQWLYEHAYIVAGARFGWWHGAEALQALIQVDKRAETLWGVGSQSRTTAEKALAEVRARAG